MISNEIVMILAQASNDKEWNSNDIDLGKEWNSNDIGLGK